MFTLSNRNSTKLTSAQTLAHRDILRPCTLVPGEFRSPHGPQVSKRYLLPRIPSTTSAKLMNMPTTESQPTSTSFSDRIKLLIQRVGSATEIARMCGFSEGVVRSWRDGNTDPSRARCVTLARTLGISLVWLVAGEGALQQDVNATPYEEQHTSEKVTPHRSSNRTQGHELISDSSLDTQRLNTAVQILQSELSLTDSKLALSENADLIAKLYEILGPHGSHVDPLAMVVFNRSLSERIHKARETA